MGTHYDRVRGGCILDGVVAESQINLLGEIAAGIAVTVLTDGAALVPVVVSIGTDLAFAAVQDWQRKIPYNDYQDFLARVISCSEDTTGILSDAVRISGIKSIENKYCLSETIRQNYQLVVGQMSLLAPEDQKILSDVFANITANIGDSEYIRAASESEISLLKQGRNLAGGALLAGLFFIQPEKVISKFDNVAHNIARLRFGASRNFTKYLDDFKQLGRNVGLPIERLSMSDWQALNKGLVHDGVELIEQNGRMVFSWNIENIAKQFNKFPIAENGYHLLYIKEGDNVDDILGVLQNNGFYVSAWTDSKGGKFLAASRDNRFHGSVWDNPNTNWLIRGDNIVVQSGAKGLDLYAKLVQNGIRGQLYNGFFYAHLGSGDIQCMTGLKFHGSVYPDDLEKASYIVQNVVTKHGIAKEWKVFLDGMSGSQLGKDFTIYVSPEGYSKGRQSIQAFLNDLESSFRANGIRSNGVGSNIVNGDKPVLGSTYFNYRYDRVNSMGVPDGSYNSDYKFVAPRPEYGGDVMNGIRVN